MMQLYWISCKSNHLMVSAVGSLLLRNMIDVYSTYMHLTTLCSIFIIMQSLKIRLRNKFSTRMTLDAENKPSLKKIKNNFIYNQIKVWNTIYGMGLCLSFVCSKYWWAISLYGNRILIIIQRPPLNETENWKGEITHSRCWNNNSVKLNFDAFYSGKESVRKQQH